MWNKKEMSQLDALLTRIPLTSAFDLDLWPWIFKVKLYLGNGRPNCHRTKGMGVNRMPWCETQPLCDLEAEDIVRDQGDVRCRSFRWLVWLYNSIETLLYNCGISGKHWNGQIEHLIDIIRYISCILYSKLLFRESWLSKIIFFCTLEMQLQHVFLIQC